MLNYIIIHNVVCISKLFLNLISISKVISMLNYTLTFSNDVFKIQEMNSLKMTSVTKLKEG